MPPLAIAAGIGAAASIGGAYLSSKATKKAANKAAQTATDNTAANNALTREIYNRNTANLSPFMSNGLAASNALSGLLLGPQAAPQQPALTNQQYGRPAPIEGPPEGYYPWDEPQYYGMTADQAWAMQQPQMQAPALQVPQPQGTVTAQNPWDQFRNSTNYQFRLNEGMGALNRNYAARGLLESGAAMKGINSYAQNFASNELGNYMALLAGQQNMGMAGASALAGVGQNMVNNVTANNNAGASAVANSQLISGNAQGQMYGQIAGALGNLAGSFTSSYKQPFIGGGATTLPYGGALSGWGG